MQNKFVYAIPSYNRGKKQRTVEYLSSLGIPKNEIIVFVQTQENYEEYKREIGEKATIIYKKASRGVEARNNILNELINKTNVLMLDDDISAIGELSMQNIKKIETADRLESVIIQCFDMCEKSRVFFFGVYPIYNSFFMSDTISTKAPVNTLFGFCAGFKGRYDETYDTKEDAALCASILSVNRSILRFNYLAVEADHRKTKDGYIDKWHQEENIRCVKKLVSEYPKVYVPQTNKPWEVRTIIKDKKIKRIERGTKS